MNAPAAEAARQRLATFARGLTLIEVLAALVIVALGMLGVIEAVTQSARNGTYLREKTLAHWIAMNVITEQRLQPEPPAVTESSANVEFAGQRWEWTMRVTQTQVESLRRMDVSVRQIDSPEKSSLATVTGFYGTAIGPAGGGVLDWSGSQSAGGQGDDGDGGSDGQDSGKKPVKGDGSPADPSGQPGSQLPAPSPAPQPPSPEDE
jgi:general secretion pathway protein I